MLILGAWCERKPVGAPVWYRLCCSVSGGFAAGCAANPLGFAPGRGLENGKLFPRRNVPYVKFPAARGGLGREEALPRSRGFLLDHEAAAQQKSGGPMLKSALEGLK